MGRYGLWAGLTYYPGEGLEDFVHAFDTKEEAEMAAGICITEMDEDWWQVVDLATMKCVSRFARD